MTLTLETCLIGIVYAILFRIGKTSAHICKNFVTHCMRMETAWPLLSASASKSINKNDFDATNQTFVFAPSIEANLYTNTNSAITTVIA